MGEEEKGLLWKLPVVKSKGLGKLGPAVGYGAGCGVGFGLGLFGGSGFGVGFPGLQFGFGIGTGCGIGIGFGYGVGRGVAYDEKRKYSNVGKLPSGMGNLTYEKDYSLPFVRRDQIEDLIDEHVKNTKKLVKAASEEIDKWR